MRIISGLLKGRHIEVQNSRLVRPTSDRVREAIFSTLETMIDLKDAVVLDLYAGSGALGIEALSRGAQFAAFVEKIPNVALDIEKTIVNFGLHERAKVYTQSVEKGLSQIHNEINYRKLNRFDLIFADPPYNSHPGVEIVSILSNASLLKHQTILVIECDKRFDAEQLTRLNDASLTVVKTKCKFYGDTQIVYLVFQERHL
jgi:16S rRNA (guanine966-N2)-methyltransferase